MVEFLIKRPVAVLMAYLAVVILGIVTFYTLPVSLLPDVDIPHITVKVTGDNMSAREIENTMTTPLRRQLMQVSGLSEIRTETRDASGVIHLTMDYGVDTDLAFIEVNEKIDAAMSSLPRDAQRPKAVKASATDIPVLYLSVTPHSDSDSFLELAQVVDNIVRRRLEQLPEIAMVDATGIPSKELRIIPDKIRMKSASFSEEDIRSALNVNNAEPGSLTVRDGYYEYNISVSNRLRTPDDVRNIKITKNGRIYNLGDFCDVILTESKPNGFSTYNGKRAVTLALFKHGAESMYDLEEAVDKAIENLSSQYPNLIFSKSRSQTELLDFTISNLEQNLILGLILVFLVCAVFLKSVRIPFIIGLTIIVAVIVTFLLFYFFHVSINIISLAGLILAVGMMIDNSTIVAENITQFRQRGYTLLESCINGTNEMITPMLSSSLTTVAVFVPLVFMSGIAGAIFTDQAFAITAGLGASYIVGITLMPVLYHLMVPAEAVPPSDEGKDRWSRAYDKGVDWVFSHKIISMAFAILSVVAVVPLFKALDTESMPRIDSAETMVAIDWNENISIQENLRRTQGLLDKLSANTVESSSSVGAQDYMLNSGEDLSSVESELYLRTVSPEHLQPTKDSLSMLLRTKYPSATLKFAAPANVFEKVFSNHAPPLEARLSIRNEATDKASEIIQDIRDKLKEATGDEINEMPMREQIILIVDQEKLSLYGTSYSDVLASLQAAFKGSEAAILRSDQAYIPVRIGYRDSNMADVLANTMVLGKPNSEGYRPEIPLSTFITTSRGRDFKTIQAGEGGEFTPLAFHTTASKAQDIIEKVSDIVAEDGKAELMFSGSIFSNATMMKELIVILSVSLLMMYFILCAQFESFLQPLIVLIEIPVDLCFALLSLLLFGQTLNLMSAIGIIVTCGIVVNDSILKLDSINELRKAGSPLLEAIHIAGHRRLKPIIMTSITTIVAMVPVLFTSDMGSELQRPLAIAMIGSMVVGTIVSIFLIPLIYFLIYRRHHVKTTD